MNTKLLSRKILAATAALAIAAALSACGGGGCDAGEPLYKNQKYECETPAPTTPASGAAR